MSDIYIIYYVFKLCKILFAAKPEKNLDPGFYIY
jgi:hypothetical protein